MTESDDKERVRQEIERRLKQEDVECPRCGSSSFHVEVWDVGAGREESRGAIICRGCGARLNVESTI